MASSSDNETIRSVTTASTFTSPRSLGYNYSSSSAKPSKERLLNLLLNLYIQQKEWKKFGKLKTCCNNFFVIAPVQLWWLMTEIYVILTVVVFTYEFFFLNWVAVIPAIILALLEWLAFYKTCLRDPGVMQRPDFPIAMRNLVKVLTSWERGEPLTRSIPQANGRNEHVHYCWRCHHFRALTTSHCGTCNCCMIQHDHHCPIFGGCVAKNNLSAFHTMAISMTCFWLYIVAYSVYNMASTTEQYVRKETTGEVTDSDFNLAARLTFYLFLIEVATLLTIPPIVHCCQHVIKLKIRKLSRSKNVNASIAKTPSLAGKVLKFAVDANFPVEEEQQLREILQTDIDMREDLSIDTKDMNQNDCYAVTTTTP